MNSSLEHIDDYFNGLLTSEEKIAFEQRCLSDEAFAEEVAAYISLRNGIADHLAQQKKQQFAKLQTQLNADQENVRRINLRPLVYLAAASILLFLGWFLFFLKADPRTLASRYAAANLEMIGLKMGKTDSLQTGITAYNLKRFTNAENVFKSIIDKQTDNAEAIKYLGLTHLAMKQYDNALDDFERLSKMKLYSNPGLFFKALTLMERSEGQDTKQAKEILNEIIIKNLYGSKQAKDWITKL